MGVSRCFSGKVEEGDRLSLPCELSSFLAFPSSLALAWGYLLYQLQLSRPFSFLEGTLRCQLSSLKVLQREHRRI